VLYLLQRLHEADSWRLVFNLFRYVTFRAALAAATAFVVTVLLLPVLIRYLRARRVLEKAENPHSQRLAELQRAKNDVPTMGGVGILAGILASGLLWADLSSRYVLLALLATLSLGAIGLLDDWMKLVGIGRRGMSGRLKLLLQFVVASGVGVFLACCGGGPFEHTALAVPFVKPQVFAPDLGLAYIAFAALVVVGSSNAVNLSDGLDGLASGCTAIAALALAVLAYVSGHARFAEYLNVPFVRGAEEMTVLCAGLAGAALGFLWFNAHPAEIFMGDTGSLAMGGLLGVAACVAKNELQLAILGGVFVAEAGSVLLQVGSYRLLGRRIFRIAPIHHHFQFEGWPENKVVVRFWIAALMFALAGLATLKIR